MSEEFIEDLFDFPGNLNAENVEQVITKAYLNPDHNPNPESMKPNVSW